MNRLGPARTIVVAAVLLASMLAAPGNAYPDAPSCDGAALKVFQDADTFALLSTGGQRALTALCDGGAPTAQRPTSMAPGKRASISPAGYVNDYYKDTTTADTQNETTITLDTAGNPVVAYNDSGSTVEVGSTHYVGWSTWSSTENRFLDQGSLKSAAEYGDPVLARDASTSRIYLSSLNSSAIAVFRSDDEAASFPAGTATNPVVGVPGGAIADKPWIAVDNNTGPGHGDVYESFAVFGTGSDGIYVSHSQDGGATWNGTTGGVRVSAGLANGSYVAIGSDHQVYVAYLDVTTTPPHLKMVKSTNRGLTFSSPVEVAALSTTGLLGTLGLTETGTSGSKIFRTPAFPQVAVDPVSGDLYMVWNDKNGGDPADVFMSCSSDGGATWSSKAVVNDDGTTTSQFMPTIGITPGGDHLMAGYYDRSASSPADTLIQHAGRNAQLGSGPCDPLFGSSYRDSGQFPVVVGQDPRLTTQYMGDYDQIAPTTDGFYTTWGDNSAPGHDSGPTHSNQPDVAWTWEPASAGMGSITVKAPTSSAVWSRGTRHRIKWTFTEPAGAEVSIQLYKGSTFVSSIASVSVGSAGAGKFAWKVPTKLRKGKYRILVQSSTYYLDVWGWSPLFSIT